MLFDGRHRELFLDEGRTQFSFRQIRTNDGNVKTLYVTTNILKLVAIKAADLLFGQTPLINSDNPDMNAAIAALMERCGLPGKSWAVFNTTPEDQEAGKAQTYGVGLYPDGKEITFAVTAGEGADDAWSIGGGTYDFEVRYYGTVQHKFTAVVKEIQDVDEDNQHLTDVTLKPSGDMERTKRTPT